MRNKKSCIYYCRRRKNFLYCQMARVSFKNATEREKWYFDKCASNGKGCSIKTALDSFIKNGGDDLYGVNLNDG